MLKKKIIDYKKNFIDEIKNSNAILTAGDKTNGVNGMTVSWGGIGELWGLDVIFVFVRKSRYTHESIEKSDSVTLSFLNDEYKNAKLLFGNKSGRDINKPLEAGVHLTYDPDYNGYYLKEASYVFKTKKLYSIDIPYDKLPDNIKDRYYSNNDMHTMYICEIKQFLVNEE